MGIEAAILGGAGISAAAGLIGGNSASKAQSSAADKANATQMAQYAQTRADTAAARNYGTIALDQLGFLTGNLPTIDPGDAEGARLQAWQRQQPGYGSLLQNFTASDLNSDPVYQSGLQFGLDQGTQGINRLAAASGNMLSGATLKALTKFGNDYGSTKANESFNRFNTNKMNTYNMLSGIAGTGQAATNQVSSAGQNMANNVSQNQIGVGNARAASAIGGANALTGALGQGWNAYQGNQLINRLNPQPTSYLSDYTPAYAGTGSGGWTSGSDLLA